MAHKKGRPSVRAELLQERKGPRKNRMIKSEMTFKRTGPDDPSHPDYMKGAYKTAQRGLKRAKIERDLESLREKVASVKLKAKKKQKKKPITVKQHRDSADYKFRQKREAQKKAQSDPYNPNKLQRLRGLKKSKPIKDGY